MIRFTPRETRDLEAVLDKCNLEVVDIVSHLAKQETLRRIDDRQVQFVDGCFTPRETRDLEAARLRQKTEPSPRFTPRETRDLEAVL